MPRLCPFFTYSATKPTCFVVGLDGICRGSAVNSGQSTKVVHGTEASRSTTLALLAMGALALLAYTWRKRRRR